MARFSTEKNGPYSTDSLEVVMMMMIHNTNNGNDNDNNHHSLPEYHIFEDQTTRTTKTRNPNNDTCKKPEVQ